MAAAIYSFVIEQGTTVNLPFTYSDSSGNPVDLTSYAARMHVRPTIDSNTVYIALSSSLYSDGTGIYINPPSSGSVRVHISAVSSSLLNFDEGVYDLELVSGSFVDRILMGSVKLSKEVTR